ncbi:hypothetical protein OHB06_18885 [Streptomyces sp. NBC_01604]|uniref:hypothetical protein n=1 Tax=Streptomyces sp. NBC_01604 TaxID=2975894 RepID=UPI003864F782
MAAIVGAFVGFTLSAWTRKTENARDDRIRNDEREHEEGIRGSTIRNTSLESLARAKRESFRAKMERLEKVLRDRQETFEELTALRILAAELKSIGLPDTAAMKPFRILPFSFVDQNLRENLVNLSISLKVYSLMPSKAMSRRRQLFTEIGRLAESCFLDVETERDRASVEVLLHKREGKLQLEEELENLMRP